MTSFLLRIEVDPASVGQLNEQGYQLCLASAISSGGREIFNVVAYTSEVQPQMEVELNAQYAIAASRDSFQNGMMFTVSTGQAGINLGQSYSLSDDWNGNVQSDPNVSPSSFAFINQTGGGVAAVVYERINGSFAPIYVSPNEIQRSSIESLTPVTRVKVWFSGRTQSGTMFDQIDGPFCEVDFSSNPRKTVSYSQGNWNESG